jgi:hypothetical protein
MKETLIRGAFFGDVGLDGSYVATIPHAHIETHLGDVKFPDGELTGVWFPRLTSSGGFKFAGQLHDTVAPAVEWDGSKWNSRSDLPLPAGTSPVIYDLQGHLHSGAPGSQGFRYVRSDGSLVSGDETYFNPALSLNEWTDLGDGLVVGQDNLGRGAVLYEGTNGWLIYPHDSRFIRALRSGDDLAMCFTTQEGVIVRWGKLQEFKTIPLEPVHSTPTPVPSPVPPSTPKPEEPPMTPTIPQNEIDRAKQVLSQVRTETKFGPGKDDLPYVKEVARRLGPPWGLNGKRGDPNNLSHDILAWFLPNAQPILVDVLGDGGGDNTAQFGILEYPQAAGAVWVAAGAPDVPSPLPTPSPTPSDALAGILARLGAIEGTLMEHISLINEQKAQIDDQNEKLDRITAELNKPLIARANCGRIWGHAHGIDVTITRG